MTTSSVGSPPYFVLTPTDTLPIQCLDLEFAFVTQLDSFTLPSFSISLRLSTHWFHLDFNFSFTASFAAHSSVHSLSTLSVHCPEHQCLPRPTSDVTSCLHGQQAWSYNQERQQLPFQSSLSGIKSPFHSLRMCALAPSPVDLPLASQNIYTHFLSLPPILQVMAMRAG